MNQGLLSVYRQLYDDGVYLFGQPVNLSGGGLAAIIKTQAATAVFLDASRIKTVAEEACVMAHEAGHIYTGATDRHCAPRGWISKRYSTWPGMSRWR